MKKIILHSLFFIAIFGAAETFAQVRLNVNLDLSGRNSRWNRYDGRSDYYYYPDIDMFYEVRSRTFIVMDGGRWVFLDRLPRAYRRYDIDRAYRVLINDVHPYRNAGYYRNKYRSRRDDDCDVDGVVVERRNRRRW